MKMAPEIDHGRISQREMHAPMTIATDVADI